MRQSGQTIEVIQLNIVDPQTAVLSINRLFGGGEEGDNTAPKIDADLTTRRLLVRTTPAQIAQIQSLLEKLGESPDAAVALKQEASDRSVRVLPMNSTEAQAVLEQIQQIWPAVRPNRIRTVTPSAVIRSVYPRSSSSDSEKSEPAPSRRIPPSAQRPSGSLRTPPAQQRTPAAPDAGAGKADGPPKADEEPAPRVVPRTRVGRVPPQSVNRSNSLDAAQMLAQLASPAPTADATEDATAAATNSIGEPQSGAPSADDQGADEGEDQGEPGADIVIAVGPTGLIIASKDPQALNDFEDLLNELASRDVGSARDFAVFYLRHSTADAATEILNQILSGGSATDSSGGDGGLLDGLASAALGDMGGGLMGSLLGMGGGTGSLKATGSYSIVPEPRLNMLVVQANATDMQLIEQLLQIVDQHAVPKRSRPFRRRA